MACQYFFTDEILSMMHAFGDSSQPSPESAKLIELIVHEQLDALIDEAGYIAQIRESPIIGAEDVLFLLRKDKSKLVRLINHLYVKDIKSTINEGTSNPAELRMYDVTRSQQSKRVKICYDYLSQLDEFSEYKKVFNQALFDEIKNQRLRRIDSLTRNMSHLEYVVFTKARQVSFMSRVKPERFSEWLLSNKPDAKISMFAFEMIQYLAHETVAQIVDLSLLVKQDMERDPHDPLSVLITSSSHNSAEKANLNSHCQQPRYFNIPYNLVKPNRKSKCIMPSHIHEAMRRYCVSTGPYKDLHHKNRVSSLTILCIWIFEICQQHQCVINKNHNDRFSCYVTF